jgi:hypothetical protein
MKKVLLFIPVVLKQLLSLLDLNLHTLSDYLTLLYLRGDLLAELVSLTKQLNTELDFLFLSHFRGGGVCKGEVNLLVLSSICFCFFFMEVLVDSEGFLGFFCVLNGWSHSHRDYSIIVVVLHYVTRANIF